MLKTEAIKNVLMLKTHPDLAALYTSNMEVQINVAKDNGTVVEGDYKGRRWNGYTDGATTWKPFRIPYNANTEPNYTDTHINFDLAEHAEGIGMTGWDWKQRLSCWVAFDFDAMCGHSEAHTKKMTADELLELQRVVRDIPWVTVRKSTSGKGLHLYVFLVPTPTQNHTEHAALARAILSMMSAHTGYNFTDKVDICGGNMWVWHRKMIGTDGLKLLKVGEKLVNIPENWKEHTSVINRTSRKSIPGFVQDENRDSFDVLTQQFSHVPLDATHKKLINWLDINKHYWAWHADHHMLIAHTAALKEAHTALQFRGIFDTNSKGSEPGDHNCFMFPLKNGAWSVRRYGQETKETPNWQTDQKRFTYCYYNKNLDLKTACLFFGGIEHEKGGWVFREAEIAQRVLSKLDISIDLPPFVLTRPAKIIPLKEQSKITVHIEHQTTDAPDKMTGWHPEKKLWKRVFYINLPEETEMEATEDYDGTIRHVVNEEGDDAGWRIKIGDSWRNEPYVNVRLVLKSSENNTKDIDLVLSQAIKRGWRLVNRPFQGEYPGDRQWNIGNAKLKIVPSQDTDTLSFPTWQSVLEHCGESLNEALQENEWAKENNVTSGAIYLKLWLTALIKHPTKSLPYLCFWGDQDCGKSTFHEAITEILIENGHIKADNALVSQSGFNGELEGKILAIVEEIDLKKSTVAANRMKDWVTSTEIAIHRKGQTPYTAPNYTHWVQCANDRSYCPVFPGDSRITLMHVGPLKSLIGRDELRARLKKEAPDFLASILATEVPFNNDRLLIPTITTRDKLEAEEGNMTMLQLFLQEKCHYVAGAVMKVADFFDAFKEWLPPDQVPNWSKQRVSRELPSRFVKGKDKHCQHCYGNISFTPDIAAKGVLIVNQQGFLKHRDTNETASR